MKARPTTRNRTQAQTRSSAAPAEARHGLARVLSKSGVCSRTEAARWISDGRVTVDGRVIRNPEFPTLRSRHRIAVDGQLLGAARYRYLMLNKPRGLVTTVNDESGRDTVYRCFDGAGLPWLAPVGRLDKASEGLLLFTNDPEWAARLNDPLIGQDKIYHVQIDAVPDAAQLARITAGVSDRGEHLGALSIQLLRSGVRNAWVEIVLEEGKNRQIRRLLQAFGINVLRLMRVAIGPLQLGELPKGQWRELDEHECRALSAVG